MNATVSLLERARALLNARRPLEARTLLYEAAARDPRDPLVQCYLSRAERQAGNPEQALDAARRASTCDPTNQWAFRLQADALIALGRAKEAVRIAREAVHLAPGAAETQMTLGRSLIAAGQPAAAMASLEIALRMNPGDPDPFNLAALALIKLRRYREAEPLLRDALAIDPMGAMTWNNLAVVFLHTGRRREAIDPLKRALDIDPALRVAVRNLRVAGSGHVIGKRPLILAVFAAAGAFQLLTNQASFPFIGAVVAALVVVGWWRRATWFGDFSPLARRHIFRRAPKRVLTRLAIVLGGTLGALAGIVVGDSIANAVTGDAHLRTAGADALVITFTVAGAVGSAFVGIRLGRRNLNDE